MIELGAAAIFKRETPHLREWIEYHRLVGVERFWLFCNDDDPTAAENICRDCDIDFIHSPGYAQQHDAYREAFELAAGKVRWLAVLDLDEFLLPRKTDDVREVLNHYPRAVGVTVAWTVFAASDSPDRPLLVTDECRWRPAKHPRPTIPVKSISRPEWVLDGGNQHVPLYKGRGPIPLSPDVLRINHYILRSRFNFEERTIRGPVHLSPADPDYHTFNQTEDWYREFDRKEVFDDELWRRFGARLLARMAA